MNKQPEDWLDDVPENENEDDDEIIWVSKSEIKRDAEALKDTGPKWSIWAKRAGPHSVGRRSACRHRAGAKDQERGPPPSAAADRQDAARPRYRADPDRARQAENRHNQQVSLFHKLEALRDRPVEEGDDVIPSIPDLYPAADRQQLRSLVRNAQKEKAANKPPKAYRQIFQYLRELAEAAD